MYKGTDGQGAVQITPTATPTEQNLAFWVTGIGADVVSNLILQNLLTRDYPQVVADPWAVARLFALSSVATVDANIVNQYNKRKFNFWRPRDALLSTLALNGAGPCVDNGDGTSTCPPGIAAFFTWRYISMWSSNC